MTDEQELPFGEIGDLMESLVPIATRLVEAVREEGPDAIRGVLHCVPKGETAAKWLPGDAMGALCLVLAAMVDENSGLRSMLGWTDELIAPGLAAQRYQAIEAERARLLAAGVQTPLVADQMAEAAIAAQEGTRERMLRVVHGGRESA